jgi:3-hydroxy-5-phosphonooxypentane-2,4-dione thiolase
VASCPVPLVVAGGKKVPEAEALDMAYRCVNEGAAGVDMGRNIFQSEHPSAMMAAVRGVVHDGLNPVEALDLFRSSVAES